MDYEWVRATAIRNAYAATVRDFLGTYRRGRPTIVLLPGGMGSQLDRSPHPFDRQPSDFIGYDPVWIDPGLLFAGDGLKLEIDAEGRDRDGHVIVPNGPLRYGVKAYDGVEAWAAASGFNFIVFGYDWRRPIEEAAGYLEYFLGYLRDAVFRRHTENPLPRLTLLAHSQGGLVAKVFLHRIVDMPAWTERLVTVATPFYGTWSHMQRYYAGQAPLNTLHGAGRVARIVGTLPGPYVLMFLDRRTFERDGAHLGLDAYPVIDDADLPLDPYDRANLARYPAWIDSAHLERARRILATVTLDLPPAVIRRVFNIRSVLDETTPIRLRWRAAAAGFDPDGGGDPPVMPAARGGGDGTVPGWAAWLAQTPAGNRIDLTRASSHADLVEHEEVLNIVGALVDPGYVPVAAVSSRGLYGRSEDEAGGDEIEHLADDIAKSVVGRDDPRLATQRLWRGLMREFKR